MAPSTIILCRHAQAFHNVDNDYTLLDASLTDLGKQQCSKLPHFVPEEVQKQVKLIVTSPLRRTLQTTMIGWGPTLERLGIKNAICLPQLQECNDYPCDTGSPREFLEGESEFNSFDLSLLTPDWTSKRGQYAADETSLNKRAQWIRQWLRERKEDTVLVVAHGDILRRITGGPSGNSTHGWNNAEARTYEFDPKYIDSEECWLTSEGLEITAGGWQPTSTEFAGKSEEGKLSSSSGQAPSQEGSSAGRSSSASASAGEARTGGVENASLIAELEGKVAEKLQSVEEQARELKVLEERLRRADERRAALEAKGIGGGSGSA